MIKRHLNCLVGISMTLLLFGCGANTTQSSTLSEGTAEIVTDASVQETTTESSSLEDSGSQSPDTQAVESTESEKEVIDITADIPLKELCSDYFTLGVGINGSTLENQTLNIPEYMELSKKHFNSCTMTNLMKSCYILDQAGSQKSLAEGDGSPALNFASIDPTLQWCMENGMKMRGHTLVWHTQAPEWFFRENYSEEGSYVDKETMLFRMESYIAQLMTHVQDEYPGVVYCWDVVNEAVDPDSAAEGSEFLCRTKHGANVSNPWYETIGEDYVEMAFTYARKYAAEDVKLFYNDYNTFQTAKMNAIYKLCSSLKEKDLIDGIGMQGYWGLAYPSITTIETAIKKYAKLDLEIHITELSIGVDEENETQFEKQAKHYEKVFTMLGKMDKAGGGPANITNVTLFGLVDHYREGDTTNSRIFDKNYEPKPAFDKIKEVMITKY